MIHIILELTKYIIIFCVAIYTLTCFKVFRGAPAEKTKRLYRRQEHMLLLYHFFANLNLILEQKEIELIYFYGVQLTFLLFVMICYRRIYPKSSRLLTNNMLFFMVTGLIMQTRLSYVNYAKKHAIMLLLIFIICMFLPVLMKKLKFWEHITWVYGIGGLLLLATVFVFGVTMHGACNWITIAGITLQPSEFAKILFVLFVACRLSKSLQLPDLIVTTALAIGYILVLVAEKDLGGALIFFTVYIVMLYVATGRLALFISGMFAFSGAAVVAYRLFSHVRVRVNTWLNPWSEIGTTGYQICQSLFAIGTGGWFGLGLGQGAPENVPVVYSDFIFSALAEEMGTIFVLSLILIYVSCFIVFLDISMHCKNAIYKFTALGFGVCFLFQVFLNIGGAIKFIPLTGVTLPLVSYGRSSVISVLLLFGITQGLSLLGNSEVEINEEKENNSTGGEYSTTEQE